MPELPVINRRKYPHDTPSHATQSAPAFFYTGEISPKCEIKNKKKSKKRFLRFSVARSEKKKAGSGGGQGFGVSDL